MDNFKEIVSVLASNGVWCMAYVIVINCIAIYMFYRDKRRAVKNQWRIKESTLIVTAFLGGAIGALIGMGVFHHKIRKPKFYIGVPVILVFHVILLIVGVLLIY